MFSEVNATRIKTRALRFWSMTLSAILAITVLQVAPPAKATQGPSLAVNLVPRFDDEDIPAAIFFESSLSGTISNIEYRLDLDIRNECGAFQNINQSGISGIRSPSGESIDWSATSDYFSFVGLASNLELVLDNLRIIREVGQFGPEDCNTSSISSYLMDINGTFPDLPQGRANYFISTVDPFPLMTDYQSNGPHVSPRLNIFSDGFEVEWDEYLGATGFTPAGFAVRYRTFDGTTRGSWNYVSTQDGTYKSLLMRDLVDTSVTYEFQAAPTIQNCDNQFLFGRFTFLPSVGATQLGDPSVTISTVGLTEQQTGGSVVSQCANTATAPVITSASNLENASINYTYSQFIVATGSNLSYAIAEGEALPTGLALNSNTGEIAGTPGTLGTFVFSVVVTDSITSLTDTEEFTIAVQDEIELPIDISKGGVTWRGVGSGISDVEADYSASTFDDGNMKAFWLDSLDGESTEIRCPDNVGIRNVETGFTSLQCYQNSLADGLLASLNQNFMNSDPWHQLEILLSNTGSEEKTGYVKYVLDLGADTSSEIEMTSDGDLLVENSDTWLVTSGGSSGSSATTLHYFGFTFGQAINQGSGQNRDKIYILRPVSLLGGSQETIRFVDGVVDFAPNTQGDSVVTAINAGDQLQNATFQSLQFEEITRENVLDVSFQSISATGSTLPALRTVYECSDFGKQALYPVVVNDDGKPFGCDLNQTNASFPGDGPGFDALSWGLAPGGLNDFGIPESWISQFRATFPNASPRYGWACNSCVITESGPVELGSQGVLANGIPLGFKVSHIGSNDLDSVRILANGAVQLHSSLDGEDLQNGKIVSVFGNMAMGNESIQGEWLERPAYDFFYWSRTIYQGRVAFVITWVNIPTVHQSGNDIGNPNGDLDPTTVQLMLVSEGNIDDLEDYVSSAPDDRVSSDVDLIWNFKSIQGNGAVSTIETLADYPNYGAGQMFSGVAEFPDNLSPLISDAYTENNTRTPIGISQNVLAADSDCDEACLAGHLNSNPDLGDACDATCVASRLLSNRLQSPVDGRYVLGYREYEFSSGGPLLKGFPAPASPRNVEVIRSSEDQAVVTWSEPTPWVLRSFPVSDGTPVYGYRIQYVSNERDSNESCNNNDDLACATYPTIENPALTIESDEVTTVGSGDSERLSVTISNLARDRNYVFRVFAVYSGIDFPPAVDDYNEPIETDFLFVNDVRSVPAYAVELFDSELEINPIAYQAESYLDSAQEIAATIVGDGVVLSNATVNGSEFIDGLSAKSVASFSGGQNSVGFNNGIVLTPLLDARTFQRGSGISRTESEQQNLNTFSNPNARQRYVEIQDQFNDYLSLQRSWNPESGETGSFNSVCDGSDCANGTSYLQFDVLPTEDFLKFEYVLAGTERDVTGELYEYPDGFGLFVDGINQENSCALIPQVGDEAIEERFVSMGNARNARLAELVRFDSDLHAQSVTSALTCQADVSEARLINESVTITMIIANARDGILSPAVFIKADSIRFEETLINSMEIDPASQFQGYEGDSFTSSGSAVYRWGASGLPSGLSMNPEGYIEGTPIDAGTFTFTVIAYGENDEQLASQTFSIVVEPSQMGDDRFLQGNFVEVGIAGNGHFGSTGPAPDGFHPRDPGNEGPSEGSSGGRIGFVSDRDRDGWGVGQDDGDFFVPGSPFESFGITADGISLFNNDERTEIPGTAGEISDSGSEQSSTWVSSILENGLKITQIASVPEVGQSLNVQVTFENLGNADIPGLAYARQVDNDANVFSCGERNLGGGWKSFNRIESQADTIDAISWVSSRMSDDCNDDIDGYPDLESNPYSYLGLISTDSRSVGGLQLYNFASQDPSHFVTGITDSECNAIQGDNPSLFCTPIEIAPGSTEFADSGIGIGFDLGNLPAGDSTTINFSYVLSPEEAQEIIDAHNNENNLTAPVISLSRSSLTALVDSAFDVGDPDWLVTSGGQASYYAISPQLPAGMNFNSATGEITGIPTVTTETTRYTLTAVNLAGSASAEFLMTVIAEPFLYSDDDGHLLAVWPSDSPASVGNYEYALSSTNGDEWGETIFVTNSSQPLMSVQLNVELGSSYRIRVRPSGSNTEWLVSENYFYGLTGCLRNDATLKVLLLSSPSSLESSGTNPATTDLSLRNAVCQSQLVSLEVFDGQGFDDGAVKGSAETWRNALEDTDVLVLPRLTSGSLFGSSLMSSEPGNDAANELSDWVNQGGRLILTGAEGYLAELNDLANLAEGEVEAVQVVEEFGVRREGGANSSLPLNLPTYDQPALNVWGINSNLYVDNYGETSDWDSASLASTFIVGHGSVVALSNNFATVNRDWDKVLRQAIHSTISQQIVVHENGAYWYLSRGEIYSGFMETSGSGIVRMGSLQSPTTVSCVNTPLNPAAITRTALGTTVSCGRVSIDDGSVSTPPSVNLTRFFSAAAPWVKTSVVINNDNADNAYQSSVWFGGDLGLGDSPLLEYQGRQVVEFEENAYQSRLLMASQGIGIGNSNEDGLGAMFVRVSGQSPSSVFAGVSLEGDPAFTRNQLWSETRFSVEPQEAQTLSWFEANFWYEPGCDRYSSVNGWARAAAFLTDSEDEYSDDYFEANSSLRFPNLSESECESYDGEVSDILINSSNGRINIDWERPSNADRYEIEFREVGSYSWIHLEEFESEENDRDSYELGGLGEGRTYEFRIRPIDISRTPAGDSAKGNWSTTAEVYVTIPPSPSPSSSSGTPSPSSSPSASPSSSPSQTQAPTLNNSGPDLSATIVPQMIAQNGPGFPARLKRGKIVKFGVTAPSGLPLRVTSIGQCKTTAITKKVTVKVLVGKKIKKKKIKIQTGWSVKASKKKGICTLIFSNSGDATRSPLASAGTITVF